MSLTPPKSRWLRLARFHLPLLLLLIILAAHSLRTFGTFVVSDDLAWVRRTVSDARKPWNVFIEPLFGSYYRPIAHIVWLINYYLWGFNFDGHQAMFIGLWLIAVLLVYCAGLRLDGRAAAFIAATLVGLNDIYLLLVSWKSWYTTLTEFAAVVGWALCYVAWLETRSRRWLLRWVALAVIAVLCRELAALVISAAVLTTWVFPVTAAQLVERRARWTRFAIWAAATLAVLLSLPAYRHMAMSVLRAGPSTDTQAAPGSQASLANVAGHFRSHVQSMFGFGLCRYLVLFVCLNEIFGRVRNRRTDWRGYRPALLGAFAIGAVILALPWGAHVLGKEAAQFAASYWQPAGVALLLLLFLTTALTGDVPSRLLGAWFIASFVPILFLEHSSNAYHLLAFTALALYTGRVLARLLAEEARPAWEYARGRSAGDRDNDARVGIVLVLAVLGFAQAIMLWNGFWRASAEIRRRVAAGREFQAAVQRAVELVLTNSDASRRVWTRDDPYADLVALILTKKHGFRPFRLDSPDVVGLRAFDVSLPVYTDAIPYDDAIFDAHNAMPDGGFERDQPGLSVAKGGRRGSRALASSTAVDRAEDVKVDFGPFWLRPGGGYVFGGFLRREAEASGPVRMSLRSVAGARYAAETPPIRQQHPEWELVWECASPPPDSTKFIFRAISGERVKRGRILADDVFICPVEALIQAARKKSLEPAE